MPDGQFTAPVLIEKKGSLPIDLTQTPYFYNDGGLPSYLAALPAGVSALTPAPQDPALAVGTEHRVSGIVHVKDDGKWGVENEFGFAEDEVVYTPLRATRENAAAFGITLVEPGQAVRLECPNPSLDYIEYEYGVFAGHWSPYQGTGDALLSVVCTDLEHHDFPHVFASTDYGLPLVISVGRYWPDRGVIRLADLWVERGHALYIPPYPSLPDSPCIDLHNNRNSARAAWGDIHRGAIFTHTLLQTQDTYTHWYWNPLDTRHSRPN